MTLTVDTIEEADDVIDHYAAIGYDLKSIKRITSGEYVIVVEKRDDN
jgi:hypothetical protein